MFNMYVIVDTFIWQVLAIEEIFKHRVTNVVFMGMGEPMMNLKSVLEAHLCLNKVHSNYFDHQKKIPHLLLYIQVIELKTSLFRIKLQQIPICLPSKDWENGWIRSIDLNRSFWEKKCKFFVMCSISIPKIPI